MSNFIEADGGRLVEQEDQPLMEPLTAKERLLLRFYRQLNEMEQDFVRRAVEAMIMQG